MKNHPENIAILLENNSEPSFSELQVLCKENEINDTINENIIDSEQMEEGFPSSRIDWRHVRWCHLFWIPYIPVGVFLMFFRLAVYLLCKSLFKMEGPKLYFNLYVYSMEYNEPDDMDWENFPKNSVLVGNHHHGGIELGALSTVIPKPFYTIAAEKTGKDDPKSSKNRFLLKRKGEKLIQLYERFRKDHEEPLFVFAQGATTANHVMSRFMPPIFEAIDDETPIFCYAFDAYYPIPIHPRLIDSNIMFDHLLNFFQPFASIKVKMLGPFKKGDIGTAEDAADFCERIIAENANKKRLSISVLDKFKYSEKKKFGHGTELLLLKYLQSNDLIFRLLQFPFAIIHFLLQEPIILLLGSVLIAIRWEEQIMGSVIRSIAWTFLLTCFIKLQFRVPRPIRIDPSLKITNNVWQTDYSFPSGHSSFGATLPTAFICSFLKQGNTIQEAISKPVIIFFIISAIITGFSRVVLAMHFPIDVVYGLGLGILIPYVWIYLGIEDWYVESCKINPPFMVALAGAVAGVVGLGFVHFFRHVNHPLHLKCISFWDETLATAWKERAVEGLHQEQPKRKHKIVPFFRVERRDKNDTESNQDQCPKIEPHKMRNVFFHFGMTVGSVITLPLQQLLGPGLFDVVLKGAKDYAIALSVMLGGILILGLLIKVTDRDDIMKRSIVCSILVMWIVGFSQIAVKAII